MTRDEFEQLRDLPSKTIQGDIEFIPTASNPDVLRFEERISNSLGLEVIVNGNYRKMIPSLTFNFRVTGIGAICRFDINSTLHPDANTMIPVRTHKHSLQADTCPKDNLPHAVERTDLDLTLDDYIVERLWRQVCKEARIKHKGALIIR
jgi:hypothetical protein